MKKLFYILLGGTAVLFIVIQLFAMSGQRKTETYPYTVEETYEDFEIRSYKARLFTSVQLPMGDYKRASRKGFSILAGYIFGGNDRKEKIAMTTPVSMSLEDSMTMMFMVPEQWNREQLPQPNEAQIEFREEPAKRMAAIRFGGWASDGKIGKYKKQLVAALEQEGIPYTDKFYFFGYNPPYDLFNRRNEVLVELEE
ncbi:heme-binding protein [Algivirga pacifica]|uniref:Heme-binding protein n=1 Tax=Algivirga pacifica TaxID=1162670 RepID=A0ABP9DJJ5_9BACT